MRKLFIVAAKILGLFQFCYAFQKIQYFNFYPLAHWHWLNWLNFVQINVLPSLPLLALAYVLVFKTEWLADKVGLAENKNSESPEVNRDDLLAAGIKLIGLYFAALFSQCILAVGGMLLINLFNPGMTDGFAMTGLATASYSIMFILSMLFIFRTNAVIEMLTLAESAPWRKVVFATLGVLLVIFIITAASTMESAKRIRAYYPQHSYPPSSSLMWEGDDSDIGIIGGDDAPPTLYLEKRITIP